MTVVLLYSAPFEGGRINESLPEKKPLSSMIISGKWFDKRIISVQTGIGKVNAAHAVTVVMHRYSPDLIISFGVGGAYPGTGLNIGDIAIAEREIYGDEGVLLANGFRQMDEIGIPLWKRGRKKYFNEFNMDKKIVKKAFKLITGHRYSCQRVSTEEDETVIPATPPFIKGGRGDFRMKCKTGSFVTVSTSTGTLQKALELKQRYNPICENMEGAAITHVCAMYQIPVLEIRGISNIVDDRDKSKWKLNLAAKNCQEAVIMVLEGI